MRWKSVSKAATSGISGSFSPNRRMALMYAGLWAGATSFISSMALDQRGRHPLHAGNLPAMHRLERDGRHVGRFLEAPGLGIGQLGKALPDRLGVVGHAQGLFVLPAADLHHAPAFRGSDPFDPSAPSCTPPAMSNSRYLKLVEPRLATKIFMIVVCGNS